MSQRLPDEPVDLQEIIQNLVTEDDEPADNIFSEKQQRLLTAPLYSSWTPPPGEETTDAPRAFIASANVGIFFSVHQPPLVPGMFLSMDVQVAEDWYAKEHRSYFVWEFGKVPEVVVEVVSNRKGGELTNKLRDYARLRATYYVVHDLLQLLGDERLRVYELGFGKRYRLRDDCALPDVSLRATLWNGRFENNTATWLRWCEEQGNLIPTGAERAKQAAERARREADARQKVEARLRKETKARRQAEAELESLRKEVAQLKQK
jgi:Uma2 family endonuclease